MTSRPTEVVLGRTDALLRSIEQMRALSEVGRAVGSTRPCLQASLGALLRSLFAVTSTRSMRMNSPRSPGGSGSSMRF